MDDLSAMLPDATCRRALRRRLLAWYDAHARRLPWRRNRDPYAVWLSEIMLQQTQVETVKAYFERFVRTFPTIEALARADEHAVLRLWEGLGYYRRARQLHQAAKIIVAEHAGRFPRDPQTVRRLPGIGRYTAGAILSIAFDARQPILEANTLRLHSRLLAYADDPRATEGQRLLWAMAEIILPRHDVGRFNQALMELGSQVCTARSPRCEECPLAVLCRANQQGRQQEIPLPKIKPPVETVREAAVLVRRNGRVLLLRWPEGRRWAGLWDFPRFPVHCSPHTPYAGIGLTPEARRQLNTQPMPAHGVCGLPSSALSCELVENVRTLTGVTISPGQRLATLAHSVTRFRITLDYYEAAFVSNHRSAEALETRWLRPEELEDYPLSSTGRKLANLTQKNSPQRTQRTQRRKKVVSSQRSARNQ
jgi:A/G-specific adenine glycosylase